MAATNRNGLRRAKGNCGKVPGRPAQELKYCWPITLGSGLQELNPKSSKNSAVFALKNIPENYFYSFDTKYIEKKLKIQLNINLKLIKAKFRDYTYSFESPYIEDHLNTKKTLNTKNKIWMSTADNNKSPLSPLSPLNPLNPTHINKTIKNNNQLPQNNNNQQQSECSSTEDVEMDTQEKEEQNTEVERDKEQIPPPPPEEEYTAWLMIEMKNKKNSTLDYQAIYDALSKSGFEDTKIVEKTNGLLFNFKNHQNKRKFLQNKKLVESFGMVANDEAPKHQKLNEAILLGIDERFNSL